MQLFLESISDQYILAKLRNKQLQGGAFSGAGLVMACPEMALPGLPFMFENDDEVGYVLSKIRPRISQWFEKKRISSFCFGRKGV